MSQAISRLPINDAVKKILESMDSEPQFFTDSDWRTLIAICDGFIPSVDPSVVADYVVPNSGISAELVASLSPSNLGDQYKQMIINTVSKLGPANKKKLRLIIKFLSHRSTAILLTSSTKLISEMTQSEKESLLWSWYNSPFVPKVQLFRSMFDLATSAFIRPSMVLCQAMGFPEVEPKLNDSQRFTAKSFYRYNMVDFGPFAKSVEITTDIVIIGSGSGAGVVANRLSKKGHKVLVIERGKYFHQEELQFGMVTGYNNLFENGASLISTNGSILVLAASTFGGGSTVNWSASLKTPNKVREQYAKDGATLYAGTKYDEAMDYVMNAMGCHKNVKHSFTNQMLLDGSNKLGYQSAVIDQNTGGHQHDCGYCSFGCRFGEKQGGIVYWLREAAEHGCKFLDQTEVLKIHHKDGVATGLEALVRGHIQLTVRAKKVIVCGGSLQTPGILKRSGFTNSHIGKGLKLHPVVCTFGEFPDRQTDAHDRAIMTAVVSEFADLDGQAHGPRLEAMLHLPVMETKFYPWRNGKEFRQDSLKYSRLATVLVITRDKTSGTVTYDPARPYLPVIDYSPNKYDAHALHEGSIGAANICYIQGAQRIITADGRIPHFESNKPTEERFINDPDYQSWVAEVRKVKFEPLRTPFGSAHQMGTCRMSDFGPRYGAVDGKGHLYECKNVFVADTSVFPSASGVNPMITCMATAHIIAGNILEELDSDLTSSVSRANL
jgi:choline dehydrogenase-like flavoprotein